MIIHAVKNGGGNERKTRTPLCRPLGNAINGGLSWKLYTVKGGPVTCEKCLQTLAKVVVDTPQHLL